jgi:predicted methyltransferase
MLVTPWSAIVTHRLKQHKSVSQAEAYRLAQLRSGTVALFPELAQISAECAPPGHVVEEAANLARRLRVPANSAIDQCHTDIPSLCRRVSALLASRPITRSRVAFVGDDDLASVVLLHLVQPDCLLLLDIDERIVSTLESVATDLEVGERLVVERVDLSSAAETARVAAQHEAGFDIVVTDPPYATDGMLRFVRVAMQLTAHTGELHIAVPAMLAEAWTDDLLISVQSLLVGSGFVIDRLVPGAFTYETSDVVSSLLVARRLPGSPPSTDDSEVSTDRFYTTRAIPGRESYSR